MPLLFQPPNSPQFAELATAVSLVTHTVAPPIAAYSKFIDTVLETKPIHPQAAFFTVISFSGFCKTEQTMREDLISFVRTFRSCRDYLQKTFHVIMPRNWPEVFSNKLMVLIRVSCYLGKLRCFQFHFCLFLCSFKSL